MPYQYINKIDYKQHQANELPTSIKGSIGELRACTYFLELGYEVFRNVSPTGDGDIVIWKRGHTPIVIDVKSARSVSYVMKDGEKTTAQSMPKSNCPGVMTVGVNEAGNVICKDWTPKDHRF